MTSRSNPASASLGTPSHVKGCSKYRNSPLPTCSHQHCCGWIFSAVRCSRAARAAETLLLMISLTFVCCSLWWVRGLRLRGRLAAPAPRFSDGPRRVSLAFGSGSVGAEIDALATAVEACKPASLRDVERYSGPRGVGEPSAPVILARRKVHRSHSVWVSVDSGRLCR